MDERKMERKNQFFKLLPGILFTLAVALIAKGVEYILPVDFIGASVIAIFLGIIINSSFNIGNTAIADGVQFSSKRILKFAIILLGASLNIATILEVGQISITVMVFTLLAAFGGGYLLGKLLGLDWRLSGLISAGTGICGGSAIAAVSPVIEAEDHQVAYAMSSTFIFDMFMIILFPIMGRQLGMSDMAFGLWTGTAVNDTSSVVAAGYAFSEVAGDFATMVKLTRTLAIIPTVIGFTWIQMRLNRKEAERNQTKQVEMNLKDVFPWFILGFLGMAIINSLGFIPAAGSQLLKDISRFLMVMALGAVGLKTDLSDIKQAGLKPMVHGLTISVLVVVVSLAVQYALGLV